MPYAEALASIKGEGASALPVPEADSTPLGGAYGVGTLI
jgi:hypothetical protein